VLVDVPQNKDVPIAVGLHVSVVGGVEQHRLLVPLHLRLRLPVHVAGYLNMQHVAGSQNSGSTHERTRQDKIPDHTAGGRTPKNNTFAGNIKKTRRDRIPGHRHVAGHINTTQGRTGHMNVQHLARYLNTQHVAGYL
jgi:hypothetical protein